MASGVEPRRSPSETINPKWSGEGSPLTAQTSANKVSDIYLIERCAIAQRRKRWLKPPQQATGRPNESAIHDHSDAPLNAFTRPPHPNADVRRGRNRQSGRWFKRIFGLSGNASPCGEPDDGRDCPGIPTNPPKVQPLFGLALSGGGIRSATFNLGFLQALSHIGSLFCFDYLSTVSGGGFTGAWWSAWLARESHRPPDVFPQPEELELSRRASTAVLLNNTTASPIPSNLPDASVIAQRLDPIHFLRLFSNYLTPKTGLLSPDMWRLIAYLIRGLLCTWAALLPLLLAIVLLAQSAYVLEPGSRAAFLSAPVSLAKPASVDVAHDQYKDIFEEPRVRLFTNIMAVLAGIASMLVLLWLIESAANPALASLAVIVLCGALVRLARVWSDGQSSVSLYVFLASGGVTFAVFAVRSLLSNNRSRSAAGTTVYATPADRRNWLTQQLARSLKAATLLAVVLLTAGFSHDFFSFVFASADDGITLAVKRAGGWGAAFLTGASALYTALKCAPSTSEKARKPPGTIGRWTLAIAPPLIVVVLLLCLAYIGHALLLASNAPNTTNVVLPTLAGAAVWLAVVQMLFAIYESYEDKDTQLTTEPLSWRRFVPHFLLRVLGANTPGADQRPWYFFFSPRGWARLVALAGLASILGWATTLPPHTMIHAIETVPTNALAVAILAVVLILSFAKLDWRVTLKSSRPVVLLSAACVTAILCLFSNVGGIWGLPLGPFIINLLWISVLLGSVFAFGWLTDPNLISLHGFYKARIARAYLGASNSARNSDQITDAAPGDDVSLKALWNHDDGAPYHLINTSINLVGGSDLATSQRLAENFLMSRYHCGSARASYRCTAAYMSGDLSLATAAAISGAAVSPTMGSNTPSAALTVLLSLLNLRLGFWAPTPSGKRWYEPRARLWPYYILRETLARMGNLGSYCYLTDGGHFDNTGVYALVERGCRYIVVCDCGADPTAGFEDIGTAIRRCRIDFGTEIDLNVTAFATRVDELGVIHCTVGTIQYQREHLQLLGQEVTNDTRMGTIIWVKPTVTAPDAADVRQYGRAHKEFPQQPTAEQWYDESQFESYRKLGFESAIAAFDGSTGVPSVPPVPPGPPGAANLPRIVEGDFESAAAWFEARAGRLP